jgi:hypothetical protein
LGYRKREYIANEGSAKQNLVCYTWFMENEIEFNTALDQLGYTAERFAELFDVKSVTTVQNWRSGIILGRKRGFGSRSAARTLGAIRNAASKSGGRCGLKTLLQRQHEGRRSSSALDSFKASRVHTVAPPAGGRRLPVQR